jgi:chromate transporter
MVEEAFRRQAKRDMGLGELARLFLRLGATAFGGPTAHVAMLEDEVVTRRKWLTREEFLDLLGATNMIPGPNSTELAIHIGHRCGGFPGLLVAGSCFILPAFFFVAISGPIIPRLRRSPAAGAMLDGVNVGSLAVMAVVTVRLGLTSLVDPLTVALAVLSAVALLRLRLNSAWLVLVGGLTGLVSGL